MERVMKFLGMIMLDFICSRFNCFLGYHWQMIVYLDVTLHLYI